MPWGHEPVRMEDDQALAETMDHGPVKDLVTDLASE
jgi:hypothetical protein